MKPVNRGAAPGVFTEYDQAKADLIVALGQHCSYCEGYRVPQDLHVEHIYPKDPHPEREFRWENFLLACNTCNSYKNNHLGNRRRRGLERRYLWPHLDNTFRAFEYSANGNVRIRGSLAPEIARVAEATHAMVGLMLSPAKARRFKKLGIAYDGVDKRKEQWEQALDFRREYLERPSPRRAYLVARNASRMGYFSIWMEVFSDRPEVRRELIQEFKADPACFNVATQPRKKGRT